MQGVRKINLFSLIKKTFLLLLLIFLFSYLLNFIALIFNVSDISLVSDIVLQIPLISIIYLFIVRVFLEEWFFRSFLIRKVGVFASSLFFGLAHIFYGSIIQVIGAFALGYVLSIFYSKTKNIWPNFLAHFLYNSIVYVILINII